MSFQEASLDYSIRVGGEAGQGIQTIGDTLSKVFSRTGYHVFTHQDYMSRVRGGHNFYQIRLSDRPLSASRDTIDILVALDKESILLYERLVSTKGIVIYDHSILKEEYQNPQFLHIPFIDIALQSGGNKIMANVVATGAVLGMLGTSLDVLFSIIRETLKNKGEEIHKANINAAMAGHEYAVTHCLRCDFTLPQKGKPKMLMGVNEAVGLGAIVSGLKFYTGYPMTPSTGIMLYIAGKAKEYGIIVEQAEDEITAINMAIGASFGGVRSMTGSSGGGVALMVEGLSLAAMTETPVVIALAQRPAPATGLPTRTEQADLLFALHAGHGEFPRIIFAPGNPEQAFFLTNRAFHLSQKYQIPAFILTDQYLSDSQWTIKGFQLEKLAYRDYRIRGDESLSLTDYKRHAFTDDGVSPFAVPCDSRNLVVTDSDEHDEEGHIIEDGTIRKKMVEKRFLKKLPYITEDMNPPLLYGAKDPDIVIVGWGSTYGPMKEAVDTISRYKRIAMIHFSEIYPLPSLNKWNYLDIMRGAHLTLCVENNAGRQFARFIKAETGYEFNGWINRYDGRPFTVESIVEGINGYTG